MSGITPERAGRTVEILLVEDNPADALLTREALAESRVLNRISHVVDGVQAMAFLRREGAYAQAPRPDLVMLDLNLPRKDGRKVLAEIKADPSLRAIPVIVLTSSKGEKDVLTAYQQQASAFITKPVDLPGFASAIQTLTEFYFLVVTLPPKE